MRCAWIRDGADTDGDGDGDADAGAEGVTVGAGEEQRVSHICIFCCRFC